MCAHIIAMTKDKYILLLVSILLISVLYKNYRANGCSANKSHDYKVICKYILNGQVPHTHSLPIIWIHASQETNARWWSSFNSRNSTCINQPYEILTIKSIIDRCGGSFHVCLINDNTFGKLLPDWNIDLEQTAEPVKGKLRELAYAKLMHMYGGLRLPASFLCHRDMLDLYISETKHDKIIVGSLPDKSVTSAESIYSPSPKFLACKANNRVMGEYVDYLTELVKSDATASSIFQGDISVWFQQKDSTDVTILPPELLGVADSQGNMVCIERLVGTTPLDIVDEAYGLYIPANDVLGRTAYQWLSRMSISQILESDTAIGKHLLLGSTTMTIIL